MSSRHHSRRLREYRERLVCVAALRTSAHAVRVAVEKLNVVVLEKEQEQGRSKCGAKEGRRG